MKNFHNLQLFTFLGIFVVIFGWLSLLLAFFSFFYSSILFIFSIISLGLIIYIIKLNKNNIKFDKNLITALIVSFFVIVIFSYFTTPSIFSGRDQGSLSNAAISLSQNHNLRHNFPAEKEFFKIYGTGKALNFPGFNYDDQGNLVTHFPVGYISWLAAFYSFFGMFGFILANGITFFLFLFSFYAVSKKYLRPNFALIALILVISSFSFLWFFKYTLSENLALALVWFGIFQFLSFIKEKKQLHLIAFLLSFGLLLFVRIETIAFLLVAFVILFFKYKKEIHFKKLILQKSTLFLLIFIFLVFVISLKINSAFYINIVKSFFNSFNPENLLPSSSPINKFFYVFRALGAYAILNYIIIGFVTFFYFLKNKKNIFYIIPYLILLPSFVYIINPSITLDHPWFLRRYLFAVIPVSILYTAIFLEDFCKKRIYFYILSFFLLLTNLMISFPFLIAQENKNLLPQIEKLSSNFKKNDLILVDRSATSDPWSMMTGPMNLLYEKQAVYFFNPDDLKKINLDKFENIYIITPDFNVDFYKKSWLKNNLVFVKDYTLENLSLNILPREKEELFKNRITLPQYQKIYTYGKIYLLKK